MVSRLRDAVGRWGDAVDLDPALRPSPEDLESNFEGVDPCRPGVDACKLDGWELRHGYRLPPALRAWLEISDGFYRNGPLVHPLHAIGPMVPFARVPGLVVQPESWFELGNPPTEPVCIDLAYCWPGGCRPIFRSGDDEADSRPRLIAAGFVPWFLRLLREGGREYWTDRGFKTLGDPWPEHRDRTPPPPLSGRLRDLAACVRPLMHPGADDRTIASDLGISRGDVEAIFRHLQHAPP